MGSLFYGDDGMPVRVGPALVSFGEWERLQAVLAGKSRTRTVNAAPLLDIAWCACSGKYHLWQTTRSLASGLKTYRYYRCAEATRGRCDAGAINADLLEGQISAYIVCLAGAGGLEVQRKVLVPAADHTSELRQVRAALRRLAEEKDSAAEWSAEDEAEYTARAGRLRERRAALSALPQRPEEWRVLGTGESYAQFWARADWAERRRLLLDDGLTVVAHRVRPVRGRVRGGVDGTTRIRIVPGDDLADRLRLRDAVSGGMSGFRLVRGSG